MLPRKKHRSWYHGLPRPSRYYKSLMHVSDGPLGLFGSAHQNQINDTSLDGSQQVRATKRCFITV